MTRALIAVDVQNDFCEGGSLAVRGGAEAARRITEHLSRERYDHVVATRDAHVDPGEHFSATPDLVRSWPAHCAVGTRGAELHPALARDRIEAVFDKGRTSAAYSGFEGVDERGTPLLEWLRTRGVDEVDVAGIATDHCVRATALDAASAGLRTRVLLGLTAGVARETTSRALDEMRAAGAALVGEPIVR